jgi:hypothetical protein
MQVHHPFTSRAEGGRLDMARELRKVRGPNGRECWIDEAGVVQGVVRSGKPRENSKEHAEHHTVAQMLEAWGWRADLTSIKKPRGAMYDFDCTNTSTSERIAVELKRITLPQRAMNDLASKGYATFHVSRDLLPIPADLVHKAAKQLAGAPEGVRRCVLLAWPYEKYDDDPWWDWLVLALGRIDLHENIDEVWLTTSSLTTFFRLEFGQMEALSQ